MEIGDMIEINRGKYKHWALYIGNGEVVQLVTPDGPSTLAFHSVSSSSGSLSGKGTVTIDTLKDVSAGDTYRINNYLDDKYKPRTTEVIMEMVDKMRGRTIKYELLGDNCEHFVTFLRYGESESKQADDVLKQVFIFMATGMTAATTMTLIAAIDARPIKHDK
ncbi:unnamed protein product [Coregonus sp. 'balchen']|nr:unnamed protein product [Coregonus sp. 'balchen']